MDYIYLKAADSIERLKCELKNELDKVIGPDNLKELENDEAYRIIENLLIEMGRVTDTIKYFNKPVKEGIVIEQDNGMFEVCGITLTKGSALELWSDELEQYEMGMVENDGKGYCFYNVDMGKPMLYTGMRARIRE